MCVRLYVCEFHIEWRRLKSMPIKVGSVQLFARMVWSGSISRACPGGTYTEMRWSGGCRRGRAIVMFAMRGEFVRIGNML